MVLTLLELSLSHVHNINYDTIYIDKKYGSESVYHDIYDTVVNNARNKIRSYLRNKNLKIILKSIYVLRTEGITELINKILGPLRHYKGSLFRLATVYGVITFVESKNINEILLDLIDMADMTVPFGAPQRNDIYYAIKIIADSRDHNLPIDLMMVIDSYIAFGYFLYP